jgi:hypothetical protein
MDNGYSDFILYSSGGISAGFMFGRSAFFAASGALDGKSH